MGLEHDFTRKVINLPEDEYEKLDVNGTGREVEQILSTTGLAALLSVPGYLIIKFLTRGLSEIA